MNRHEETGGMSECEVGNCKGGKKDQDKKRKE